MLILSSKDPTSMLDTIPPPRPPVFWGGWDFLLFLLSVLLVLGFWGFFLYGKYV